jgi:hypothetical protein
MNQACGFVVEKHEKVSLWNEMWVERAWKVI